MEISEYFSSIRKQLGSELRSLYDRHKTSCLVLFFVCIVLFSLLTTIFAFRDAVAVSLINCCTSVFAGAAIFCVKGYMAEMLGKDVKDVATSGQLCNNLRTPRGSGVISTVLEHKRVVSSMRKSLEHDTHSIP